MNSVGPAVFLVLIGEKAELRNGDVTCPQLRIWLGEAGAGTQLSHFWPVMLSLPQPFPPSTLCPSLYGHT